MCTLNESVVRIGDITGFDDAEVLEVEETDDEEKENDQE